MIRKYPYTDFHELNLDWFLRQFKELKDNWDALLEANTDFKNDILQQFGDLQHNFDTLEGTVQTFTLFVTNYFDNLDVQTEINNKLNAMAADGTLGELLEPFVNSAVPGAVETWLNANVDPVGSAVMIDKSLTLGGSAADAKIVGQLRDGFNATLTQLTFTPAITADSYIKQDGTGVGSSNKYCRMSALYTGYGMRVCIIVDNPTYESQISFYDDNGVISTGVGFLGYDGYNAGPHYIPATAKKFACNFRRVDQAALTAADRTAISASLKAYGPTDTSLTLAGIAADAKATGEALGVLEAFDNNTQYYDVTGIYSVSYSKSQYVAVGDGTLASNSTYPWVFASTNFLDCSQKTPLRITLGSSAYRFRVFFYSDNLGTFLGYSDYLAGDLTHTFNGVFNGTPYTYIRLNLVRDDHQTSDADFAQICEAVRWYSPHPYGNRRTRTSHYNHFDVSVNLDWPDVNDTTSGDAESENMTTLKCVLGLPTSYSLYGDPVPVIMLAHGRSGHITDSMWYSNSPELKDTISYIIDAGYAMFDVDNTRSDANGWPDWGCLPLMSAYRQAWDYIRQNYNVQPQLMIWSFSMGTAAGLNFAKWWTGDVKCMLQSAPRPVCQDRYNAMGDTPIQKSNMEAAFGITTPGVWDTDRLKGFNQWENAIEIGGVKYITERFPPVKVLVGKSDPDFLATTRAYYKALNDYGNYVNYREITGFNHVDTCYLNSAGLREEAVRWFDRYK